MPAVNDLYSLLLTNCKICIRKGVRVVEGAALEKQYAGNGIEGSNPSSSAILKHMGFTHRGVVLRNENNENTYKNSTTCH
jgi:hypothetical protein